MTIEIVSWAGRAINDLVTYEASLGLGSRSRSGRLIQTDAPGRWPEAIRIDPVSRTFPVTIAVRGASLASAQLQLEQWFSPGTQGEFIIEEDGVLKALDAVAIAFEAHAGGSPGLFVATMLAPDPRWRGVLPVTGGRTITGVGQSFTVPNPGNCEIDDAIITLRPATAKAASVSQLYAAEAIIAWRSSYPSANYPIEITGGWAHDAEVAAGRSQADGDDVRVLVDGVDWPYWFGTNAATDPNSAATRIWINLPFKPETSAKLLAAITASAPGADGEIEVQAGGTLGWPRRGAFVHPTTGELFTYSGRTESNASGKAAFTGVRRGQRGTTAAAASAGDTVYWVEHRVQIVWGNTGASARASRPDLEPMLDRSSATLSNQRWEWLDFMDDRYPGRPAQWQRDLDDFDDQADKILVAGGSPLSALTFEYQSGGAVSGKPAANVLYVDLPCGSGSSGGNIAAITRTLADSLGMWARGVDDSGQKVILEKYAGALSSASDNITAPTNPVYRFECWAFNQVVARRPGVQANYTGIIAALALDASITNNGQQFLTGAEPVELIGAACLLTDAGASTITANIEIDNQSNAPYGVAGLATDTFVMGAIGAELARFDFSSPFEVQAAARYWLCLSDGAGSASWYAAPNKYVGGIARSAGATNPGVGFEFTLYGRPSSLAPTFERFDANCLADDGDQVTVDGVTIHLSSTLTPYVAMKARTSIYRMAPATLYNVTTGQSIAIDALCRPHDDLQIDASDARGVNLDDEDETPFVVTYSDPSRRFTIPPGGATIQFQEAGVAGVSVAVEAYPRWE